MFPSLSAGAIGVRAPLAEVIELARTNGFAGVDFSIVEVAELAARDGVAAVRRLFADAGVRPGAWGLPVDWRGDETRWREGLRALPDQAALAVELGARRCATWVLSTSDERPFEENFRWHAERFRPIAETLGRHGVRLGLEFIGPKTMRTSKRYPFIYTLDGMRELNRAIGTGNMGILLDAWHWYTSGGTLADLATLTSPEVVLVHINDAPAGIPVDEQIDRVRCLPMETGVIDLPGFLRALQAIGYDGPVVVEPFSERIRSLPPAEAVREAAASVRRAWDAAGLPGGA
ncbi:MAG: sugar phosphate isomerase/epimerase [Chloroflexi bacterium]|nr:sugar phosphate isomerase/epimerase [Chloroflexota bacterium]